MTSSAVEQHLAAALEAAKGDVVEPPPRDEPPRTLRLREEEIAEARTVLLSDGSAPTAPAGPKAQGRPRRLGPAAIAAIAAIAVAAGVGIWAFATRDPGTTSAPQAGPVAAAPAAPDAGSKAVAEAPPPPEPSGAGAHAAATVPEPAEAAAPKPSPRPKAPPPVQRMAQLSVNTFPHWSNVVLDGKAIGDTPLPKPGSQLSIKPGPHKLVLTNPYSGASRTVNFTVAPGEHKAIREEL
jgi:hypothetical protein